MNMFIFGFLVGCIATLAVSGIVLELRQRQRDTNNRYKYQHRIPQVRSLRMTGLSVREISKRTGIPKSTVHNYLND
jgi:hypothetical protein|tara:strand:- start:5573 stop:5800 length:228 start_codon:yes stop_codon:yes gene_type:complete